MDKCIFGVHAVFEALVSGKQPVERILLARGAHSPRMREILQLARSRQVPVRQENRTLLDRLASHAAHQGVIAMTAAAEYSDFEAIISNEGATVVVLDGVEDPHNLGAVIRTAEACRVAGVVVPERHSAPLSATVAKASAGAAAYMPVARVTNVVRALERMKEVGFWIVGVDLSADMLWSDFDYRRSVGLVFGGEHRGVRRLVRERCDALVRLPMLGRITSLNISAAAAVVLYEVARQKFLK